MLPELGHFALILAGLCALLLGVLPLWGAARGEPLLQALARPAANLLALLMLIAFACLGASALGDDFSVLYIARNSNSLLPWPYKIGALWGGHEGSLLLWALLLSLWGLAVSLAARRWPLEQAARLLGTLGLVAMGFLAFILLTSNPFERLLPAAEQGRDLNPLLQDPGLVLHPPLLYMGYVGFAVSFAFAIAALLGGKSEGGWERAARPWALAAWLCLTLGITLGSWWAYYELGWGGWWFWDPVENASLMPWLVGTALLHILATARQRRAYALWALLLAIGAFALSLLGTFLVRSGVLTSVHAFATDPKRGIFILLLLALTVGGSLLLFALRAPRLLGGAVSPQVPSLPKGERGSLLTRESLLLANSLLLVTACATVLLGTLYPLILDALSLGKLSVGPPYFNAVFTPLFVLILLLLPLGALSRWQAAPVLSLRQWLLGLALCLLIAVAGTFLMGRFSAAAMLGLVLAFAVLLASALAAARRWRAGTLRHTPAMWWGMQVAHCGLAILVIGVALIKNYETERDLRFEPGDHAALGGYDFIFEGIEQTRGANYLAAHARVRVEQNGKVLTVLEPQKRSYFSSAMPMTETAIDSRLTRDLYVALGNALDEKAWSLRIYIKPFALWLWAGGALMTLGALIALLPARRRL